MTTPRQHADLAVRYFKDDTMKCWARFKKDDGDWFLIGEPSFSSSNLEYYVGHEPPLPDKRTITLTVNGRQCVHATEVDAQAWVDFIKWCRGGGV